MESLTVVDVGRLTVIVDHSGCCCIHVREDGIKFRVLGEWVVAMVNVVTDKYNEWVGRRSRSVIS